MEFTVVHVVRWLIGNWWILIIPAAFVLASACLRAAARMEADELGFQQKGDRGHR